MFKNICAAVCVIACLTSSGLYAQNLLDGPESVAFDSLRNRYLVSCVWNTRVVALNEDGSQSIVQSFFNWCMGNTLVGDTLFVSMGASIVGIDLATGSVVSEFHDPAWVVGAPDGLTADTSGYLYAAIRSPYMLARISLSDGEIETFVSEMPSWLEDVIFDKRNNRLLTCTYKETGPIHEVSLPDGTLSVAVAQTRGFLDGITIGPHGEVYVTSEEGFHFGLGAVLMYDSTLTGPPVTISVPHYHPAGLDYNWRDGILAVPDFDADSVTFVDVGTPDLDCIGFILNDNAADGDGVAEAGETCELTIKIANHRGWASSVTGLLITDDPYVSILDSSTTVGNIRGWGQEALASSPFVVAIDPGCPNPHITTLELSISSAGDYARADTILLYVGDVTGFQDDMDGAEQPWIDASPAMHTGHWHREDDRAHSGSYSWKMGDTGSAPYAGWVDARLVTPPFLLEPNSVLKFWHWIDAKNAVGASAVDGGLLMLLSGDSVWTPLNPVGGYPFLTGTDFVHPLGSRTWCYSGTYDWSEAEFDLSAYSGVVRLMFRFGSGSSGSAEGWYIDDVVVGPAGNTGTGTNVVVEAGSGVTVTFEEVTESGRTDLATADTGPQPPEGYAVVPSDPAVYYDITTTAGFNGSVEVCIDYSGDQVPEDESNLCLFHYEGEPAAWLNATTTLDTAGNEICGSVTSLSQFIVARPTTCCTGPTMGNVDCEGEVDIGDVTELIKLLFINVGDPFCCEDEADLDYNGDIDIGDLTILTARLFITVTDPPPCP